jgi:hypothetical protein
MRKLIAVLVIGFLILSGLGAAGVNQVKDDFEQNEKQLNIEYKSLTFEDAILVSEPNIVYDNDFVKLEIKESTSFLSDSCKPLIPRFGKTYTYPYGTIIESINVDIQTIPVTLPAKIQPAPTPVVLSSSDEDNIDCGCTGSQVMDVDIYESMEFYPSEQYEVTKDIGLYNGELSVIVNIQCYAQYIPADDVIYMPEEITINIDYNEPTVSSLNDPVYDLLIITHENFKDNFQRLADHKNNVGVKTVLETTQEIYAKYEGEQLDYGDDTSREFFDEVEILKYRMFDAWKEWGIKYVILGGGLKGQTNDWWVPSRRVYCDDDSDHERGFESQTYFMDLVTYSQYGYPIFSCWDTNGNGVYGESSEFWDSEQWDYIAMYPDIIVGRIPFRYSWEPDIAIDKIINYETYTSPSEPWFNDMVVSSGDTSPYERYPDVAVKNNPEGIYVVNYAAGLMENDGFDVTRVFTVPEGEWGCDVRLWGPEDLTNAVNPGAGFLFVSGHSSPLAWGDHGLDVRDYYPGITLFTIRRYSNGIKLPVSTNSGCSTARFNVTSQDIIEGSKNGDLNLGELAYMMPLDFSSYLVLHPNGGTVASVGYTGLGYGYLNCVDCWNLGLSQFQNSRMYYYYVQHDMNEIYGDLYAQVLTDCINQVGDYQENINRDVVDRKHVQEWVYLGDPSLKIGGYGLAAFNHENPEDTEPSNNLNLDEADVPVWNVGNSFTYKLENVDFVFSEVEGRDLDIHLSSGQIKFTVDEVTEDSYIASVETEDVDIKIDVYFDFLMEEEEPIDIEFELEDISITGDVIFEKATLGVKTLNLKLYLELDPNALPIELPPIVLRFIKTIPLDITLNIDFDPAFKIIEFPVFVGKPYPLYETNISISGTVESKYLRLLKIVDNILSLFGLDIIPPSLSKYLPVINIAEFMTDMGMPSTFNIPYLEKFYRLDPFKVYTQKQIAVPAGSYNNCYQVDILGGIAEMYYSADAKTLVKVTGYIGDFIPYLENINLELISST